MSRKTILKTYIGLVTFVFLSILSPSAHAEGTENLVEVETQVDILKPYKARRQSRATIFSLAKSSLNPEKFQSAIDGATYSELNGSSTLDLMTISLGRKFNFSSVSIGFSASVGTLDSSFSQQADRALALRTTGLGFGLYLDGILEEPYVVPFVEGEVSNITTTEKNATTEVNASYASSSIITYGILLQLNWMDQNTALAALNSIGLENTYIKIAFQQATLNAGKITDSTVVAPDLSSAGAMQVGMQLEF